jgi:hypothetical protein
MASFLVSVFDCMKEVSVHELYKVLSYKLKCIKTNKNALTFRKRASSI